MQVPAGVEIIVLPTPKPVVRQDDFWPPMDYPANMIVPLIVIVAVYWPLILMAIGVISLILFRAHIKNNRKKNYHQ